MEFKTDFERELFNLSTKNAAEHDKLLAERDALLVALEQVESLAHSAGSMERYVSWNKVYKIARAAIAKAKGGK